MPISTKKWAGNCPPCPIVSATNFRRLYAINGLDWALTHLMWLVQTYLDRPTNIHIYWLNFTRSRKTDRENGYKNRLRVFSHGQCCMHHTTTNSSHSQLTTQPVHHIPTHHTANATHKHLPHNETYHTGRGN